MLTVAELNEIRSRVRKQLRVRTNGSPVKIVIASGTTAISSGSRAVMAAALEEIAVKGLSTVQVEQREIDVPATEQTAVLVCAHGEEVLYKQCTPEMVRELISKAVTESAE
ncbi:MAG: hypothetical protein DDT34_00831 [Firmicutes bacterium]|nr:hypothetical protein [Bacillota bacterium]